jgi:hypothetical protein
VHTQKKEKSRAGFIIATEEIWDPQNHNV